MDGDTRRAELTIQRLFADANALENMQAPGEAAAAAMVAYGWWMRCVRTAEAIRVLHRGGLGHEAAPLVRTLLHHELALLWLAQEPEIAIEALTYQAYAEANKLGSGMSKRNWVVPGIDQMPKKPKGPRPAGMELLDRVELLGEQVGRPHHYVPYRLESTYVHPSALGAQVYLAAADGQIQIRNESKVEATPLQVTARALIRATQTLAALTRDETIAQLAEAARQRFGVRALDELF
jgi:hypothetical protein